MSQKCMDMFNPLFMYMYVQYIFTEIMIVIHMLTEGVILSNQAQDAVLSLKISGRLSLILPPKGHLPCSVRL